MENISENDIPITTQQTTDQLPSARHLGSLKDLFINLAIIGGVAVLASVGTTFAMNRFVTNSADQLPIAIINTGDLAKEEVETLAKMAQSGQIQSGEMVTRSKAFAEGMYRELRERSETGLLILRAETVIAAPPGTQDITRNVRESLIAKGLMERKDSLMTPVPASPSGPAAERPHLFNNATSEGK